MQTSRSSASFNRPGKRGYVLRDEEERSWRMPTVAWRKFIACSTGEMTVAASTVRYIPRVTVGLVLLEGRREREMT